MEDLLFSGLVLYKVFGAKYKRIYTIVYTLVVPVGSVTSLTVVISFFDSAYALMAFPTMISAFILAPKVKQAARKYFKSIQQHNALEGKLKSS